MKVVVKTGRDFVISLSHEELEGLSQEEKDEMISKAVREIVAEKVSGKILKGQVAI